MNCENRTLVPFRISVLLSYVIWSADKSDFRESLVASMFEMCFGCSIRVDIHFGLIVPRRLSSFIVILFI